MAMSPTKNSPAKKFSRVIGLLEPWDPWLRPSLSIEVWSRSTANPVGRPRQADDAGRFAIELQLTDSVIKGLDDGDLLLRVVAADGSVLGSRPLISKRGEALIPITVPLHYDRRSIAQLVSHAATWRLARRVAILQGVNIAKARAPRAVLQAIEELNRLSVVAAQSLNGYKNATEVFRRTLTDAAFNYPGGASEELTSAMRSVDLTASEDSERDQSPKFARVSSRTPGA
jgi:hypothetical protein